MVVLTRRSARLAHTRSAATGMDDPMAVMDMQISTITSTMKPRAAKKRPSVSARQFSCQRNRCPGSPTSGSVARATRRPIRPVDRQKMVDWLVERLNGEQLTNNLWWLEKGETFAVKWSHASRHGFKMDERQLVKAWAKHSGIYEEGDEEDHKKWKANFRCALHSLREVEEITPKEGRKGQNAARIYRILDKPREKKASKSKNSKSESSDDDQKGDDSYSGLSADRGSPASLPLPVAETLTPVAVSESSGSVNLPNFQRLGMSTSGMTYVQQNHLSGGCMTIKGEPPQPNPDAIPFQILHFPGASSSSSSTSSTTSTTSSPLGCPSLSFSFSPSYPIPTCTTLPTDLLEKKEMEGMIPVGIMTRLKPRERTPSGDSGHPQSPPKKMEEVEEILEEKTLCISELGDVVEEISADEGIEMAQEFIMEIVEGQNCQPTLFWTELPSLPPSNPPEAVVTVGVISSGEESHTYTSLEALFMDTQ